MQKSALTATSNRRLKNPTVGRARWLRKTTFHAQNVLLQPLERGKERGNGRRSTSSALARMHTHTHASPALSHARPAAAVSGDGEVEEGGKEKKDER